MTSLNSIFLAMMVDGIVHSNEMQMLFSGMICILGFLFSSSKEQQQQKERKKVKRKS